MSAILQRPSLVAHCAQFLRGLLDGGEWREFLPGERELCARLRVSRPTLRAALEQLRREGRLAVAHGKRRRILRAPKRAKQAARKVIALLSPRPLHLVPPFTLVWMDELRERLAEAGYQLEFHCAKGCYGARPAAELERVVARSPAAAWLLYLSTAPVQRWFAARSVPCLLSGSGFPEFALPSVDLAHRAVCRHSVGTLLGKGHRRIALVMQKSGTAGDRESEEGFLEAFQIKGNTDASPVIVRHNGTAADLCGRLDELLRSAAPPTGFVVARAGYAALTVCHLMRRGRRVPADAAVISRDDDPALEFIVPTVARYVANPSLYARKVLRAVLALAEGGAPPARQLRLMPEFREGESLGEKTR